MSDEFINALKDYYWSSEDDLSKRFFIPCMEHCISYDRAVGYFSSSSLVSWSSALPRLINESDSRIRLLISPILSRTDKDALIDASSEDKKNFIRQKLADSIITDALQLVSNPEDTDLRIRLLQWLIATEKLIIRFAFASHVSKSGIYHEKIGIFRFPNGRSVAFTGSANETSSGHSLNFESIDVYRSWIDADSERVIQKAKQFQLMWDNKAKGLEVLNLSDEVLAKVKTASPKHNPTVTTPEISYNEKWQHQDEAISEFMIVEHGVLEMATGTGKTRTALRIASKLLNENKIETIIIAADGVDLLDQWFREILLYQGPLRDYTIYRHFSRHHEREQYSLNPLSSLLITSRPGVGNALKHLSSNIQTRALLIHDEVHSLGSPANRDNLEGLSDSIRYRLGLSATPEREYDSAGNEFIEKHIGPVIFQFPLKSAIKRGILSPFEYHALEYEPSDEDKERISQVFRLKAAREAQGDPMSDEELWTKLSQVHKTSKVKLGLFENYLNQHPEILERCIIFVETTEYGHSVLELVHKHRYDFHTYFGAEDSALLVRFAKGELECLLTCHRLSEGIDIRNLLSIVLFSSARSRLETIQRIGRSLRSDPDNPVKIANVVDFIRISDNEKRTPDQERAEWLKSISSVKPEGWGQYANTKGN